MATGPIGTGKPGGTAARLGKEAAPGLEVGDEVDLRQVSGSAKGRRSRGARAMGRAFLPDFARLFASSPLKAPILAAFRQRRMFPGRLFLQVDGLPKGDAFQLDSRRLQTVEASFKDRLLHFTVKDPDPVALAKPFLTLFIPGIPLERAAALERGSVPLGRALDFRTLGVEGTPAMIWCSSKHWRTGEITFDTIEYDEEGALTALAARFELLEEPSGGRISGAVAYVSEAPPAR